MWYSLLVEKSAKMHVSRKYLSSPLICVTGGNVRSPFMIIRRKRFMSAPRWLYRPIERYNRRAVVARTTELANLLQADDGWQLSSKCVGSRLDRSSALECDTITARSQYSWCDRETDVVFNMFPRLVVSCESSIT